LALIEPKAPNEPLIVALAPLTVTAAPSSDHMCICVDEPERLTALTDRESEAPPSVAVMVMS
jgi:hypothetical protein